MVYTLYNMVYTCHIYMLRTIHNIYISALEYNPTKFDNVDKNEPIKEYNTLFLPNSGDAVPNVTKLRTSTSQRLLSDGVKTNVLDITWEEPKNADGSSYAFVREYVVEYSIDNVKFLTDIVRDF